MLKFAGKTILTIRTANYGNIIRKIIYKRTVLLYLQDAAKYNTLQYMERFFTIYFKFTLAYILAMIMRQFNFYQKLKST